ncbi:putative membrane protein YdfJ with MMPL/SSD domain [Kitasatospora sp. GP30]|uniref:MMPL family transporter n=1 Tax=Kitasatospora sp. GP30 TaxID=3035084 RepID=UPI000C710114|nr:MMPL family transporter [Kitasatospora sp. GP30]MDH6142388.1 putative membrane protein YdfJ with MMPL/SSD domain [Kitasatospora sp. GP30]
MIASLGRWSARHRRWVVIGAVLFALFAGGWGSGVFGAITGGAGFDDPGSQSSEADRLLAGPLGRLSDDVVVVYRSDRLRVTDPGFGDRVRAVVAGVPHQDLARVDSYWSTGGSSGFLSRDGHATYVALQFTSADDQQRVKALQRIEQRFEVPGLTVRFGGLTAMTEQVNTLTGKDIGRAELLSVPVLLVLLVLVFRSAIAASLPLAVGAVTAVGSFAVLRLVTLAAPVSSSVTNVITILGLGLAIDYALFLVTRFREELAAGSPVDSAVERTVATAGRTVAFSGLAIAISFSGLLFFPSRFLSSMGYAGVSVVAFAVFGSLTLLPALLRITGHRVNAWRVPLPRGRAAGARWYRAARAVMRRPRLTTVAVLAVLVGLTAPILGVNWARPGDWVLPTGADARVVTREFAADFGQDPTRTMTAVVQGGITTSSQLDSYAAGLNTVPGVLNARVTAVHDGLARITASYAMDPMSRQARTMVDRLRAEPAPPGSRVLFTGMPFSRVDIVGMITARAPWMALFVALVSSVVLLLAFGSVTIPIKSVLLNLLSLGSALGAITLVFQDGWLHSVLGFTPIGAIDADFPVLIVAIAFGLAMDYEVLLLSRIKEAYDRTGDPVDSVAVGLQRTGPVITSAALLLTVVVGGFVLSSLAFLQLLGLGLVIAVGVDATVVRILLVPATMRLLGRWAWWAPAPLAALWRRVNLAQAHAEPIPATIPPTDPAQPADFSLHIVRRSGTKH